ncbi:MAG: monooxygenase [Rhizobiales bacterium]|nr:monooxygenase [Hyphomicrobiales bacterium]
MTTTLPVIIAGAGPTGLMAALVLGRHGIPVVVCEAEPGLTHDLRAGTFHPPTQEMMAPYGLTARMHETAIPVRRWQIRDRRSELVAEFDLGLLGDITPYPYRLHIEQHRVTPLQLAILRAETDADVRFSHRLTGFTQDADRVRVQVEANGEAITLDGAWLIAADGGRSTVRRATGIAFEGFTYPEIFLVVSTPYDFGQHGYAMNSYLSDPVEWAAIFKVPDDGPPGLWRAAFPCDGEETEENLLSAANVERRMQGLVAKAEPYDIRYKSIYRVHQRVAKDFRHGRVLLAGDAAHLNNPVGGFGLNSGIHDAVNVAEKLARVWKGEADAALLDRYVRQRRAICVEEVQRISIRNKQFMEERDPAAQRRHLLEFIAIANDPTRARNHLLDTSMITGVRKAAEIE